jgi:hypothetical protein
LDQFGHDINSTANVQEKDGMVAKYKDSATVMQATNKLPTHIPFAGGQYRSLMEINAGVDIHWNTFEYLALAWWRTPMPRYYFDIKDGHRFVDRSGATFKNDHDAIERARAVAIVVSTDKPEVDLTRYISVLNEAKFELFEVPVCSKPTAS